MGRTDLLTTPTGDPFVDAGGYVIGYLKSLPHLQSKDLLGLISYITDIYVDAWSGKLNAFFLNSTITQPAYNTSRKKEETLNYFKGLLNGTAEGIDGVCRITGVTGKVFRAGRDNHILSGSGKFLNFHHALEEGLFVSKDTLIRIFFAPFGMFQLADKVALIVSNEVRISKFFIEKNCSTNLRGLAAGLSKGIARSDHTIPSNALFNFVDDSLSLFDDLFLENDLDKKGPDAPSLTLYHFTNFGASPEVTIYDLRSEVFQFYAFCNDPQRKGTWSKFVRSRYRNGKYKNAIYDVATERWEGKEVIEFDSYQYWRNEILDRLISGRSILNDILQWSIRHKFNFAIVTRHQILIRNMEKHTIEKVRQLASFIVGNKDAGYIKKCIKRLNQGRTSYDLRQFVVSLNTENYNTGANEPLINVKDYSEYLFPDGSSWSEIRDLLLIAVYENLHMLQLNMELDQHENTETSNEIRKQI